MRSISLAHLVEQSTEREGLADVHRQFAAQVREARMHFGRHRPRHAAGGLVLAANSCSRPYAVGEELDDREAVPDDAVAVPQDRHLAERRGEFVAFAALLPLLVEHRDDELLELLTRLLHRQPAAHRPARIGAVADDELEQVDSLRRTRLRGLPFVTRQCPRRFRSTSRSDGGCAAGCLAASRDCLLERLRELGRLDLVGLGQDQLIADRGVVEHLHDLDGRPASARGANRPAPAPA